MLSVERGSSCPACPWLACADTFGSAGTSTTSRTSRTMDRTMDPTTDQGRWSRDDDALSTIVPRKVAAAFELERRVERRRLVRVRGRATCRVHPLRHARELLDIDPIRVVERRVVVRMQEGREEQRRNPGASVGEVVTAVVPALF